MEAKKCGTALKHNLKQKRGSGALQSGVDFMRFDA